MLKLPKVLSETLLYCHFACFLLEPSSMLTCPFLPKRRWLPNLISSSDWFFVFQVWISNSQLGKLSQNLFKHSTPKPQSWLPFLLQKSYPSCDGTCLIHSIEYDRNLGLSLILSSPIHHHVESIFCLTSIFFYLHAHIPVQGTIIIPSSCYS